MADLEGPPPPLRVPLIAQHDPCNREGGLDEEEIIELNDEEMEELLRSVPEIETSPATLTDASPKALCLQASAHFASRNVAPRRRPN